MALSSPYAKKKRWHLVRTKKDQELKKKTL